MAKKMLNDDDGEGQEDEEGYLCWRRWALVRGGGDQEEELWLDDLGCFLLAYVGGLWFHRLPCGGGRRGGGLDYFVVLLSLVPACVLYVVAGLRQRHADMGTGRSLFVGVLATQALKTAVLDVGLVGTQVHVIVVNLGVYMLVCAARVLLVKKGYAQDVFEKCFVEMAGYAQTRVQGAPQGFACV